MRHKQSYHFILKRTLDARAGGTGGGESSVNIKEDKFQRGRNHSQPGAVIFRAAGGVVLV